MKVDIDKLRQISVLYVEDDTLVREQTANLLKTLFKNVFVADDGQKGLESYLNNKNIIDVVISDINMPNLSGLEMVKEIKKNDADLPIILTTAHTDEYFILKAMALGVTRYIIKPIKIKELSEVVLKSVEKYKEKIKFKKNTTILTKHAIKLNEEKQKIESNYNKLILKLEYYEKVFDKYVVSVSLDKEARIVKYTKKFLKIFGNNNEKNLDQKYIFDILPINKSKFQKQFLEAVRNKKELIQEYRDIPIKSIRNNLVDIRISVTPKFDTELMVCEYTLLLDCH